jgi:hypothetical protein
MELYLHSSNTPSLKVKQRDNFTFTDFEIKYDDDDNNNNEVKVNVKLSLYLTKHHAMKEYWGSRGIAPLILRPRH